MSAMANFLGQPSRWMSSRSISAPNAWNVQTSTPWARGPAMWTSRSFISEAALLVKVTARMLRAMMRPGRSLSRWTMRWVMTRVLPLPAPASTSRGPWSVTTASR